MMVEIYGVAGSGKTTYVRKQKCYKAVKPGFLLKLRTLFFFLIFDSLFFLRYLFFFTGSNKKKILFTIIFKLRLVEILKDSSPKINRIYDQGPIYSLCRLLNKSRPEERKRAADLLDTLISRINSVFDETIYLRCDAMVALHRVLKRNTSHMYKKRDPESVMQDIALWNRNFDYIHSKIHSQVVVSSN